MKYYNVIENKNFVNRHSEWKRFEKITSINKAAIIVVHGRRRVGKTELIEQYFRKYNILKFEGIQSDPKKKKISKNEETYQIKNCIRLLGKYLKQESVYNKIICNTWSEFFELISPIVEKEHVILYFEEVQWLANYKYKFMAELKPFWDNSWRHNNNLKIVFSGSSPSFMVGQFISNMALYNRSQHEFSLEPFNLLEIQEYLRQNRGIGNREVMLTAITIGGICGYLERLVNESSVFSGLCINSFEKDSFFSKEYDRIFVSSMAENKYYKKILDFLSMHKFATRQEIIKAVSSNKKSSGGFTTILKDLESCGFIQKYVPIKHNQNSLLARYFISDEYLQLYLKFIKPNLKKINNNSYKDNTKKALNMHAFNIVMGFSFERWCRKNERLFAKIMNFGDVEYDSGSFFNQNTAKQDKNFQIDLMYIRADHKIIICEIKYLDAEVSGNVALEIRKKLNIFQEQNPKYKNYTFETALITTEGIKKNSSIENYFDHIITFDDIFNPNNW
ncbi:ATPase domain protein, prokaryote domain protein [Candidatus Magnetomorum sp. HK-1]|nr:ATPase domain protein, prokaryote domain protein [Candidatus Magnetomorum sp. HK-1]